MLPKKIISLLCFTGFSSMITIAQNTKNPWLLGMGMPVIDFRQDEGIGKDFLNTLDWNKEIIPLKIFAFRSLNSSLAIGTSLSLSKATIDPQFSNQKSSFIDWDLVARYKLANGYLLAEEAKVDPYLFVGGGWNSFAGNGSFNVKGGIGTNIWFGQSWGLNLQTSINKVLDGNNFLMHEAGIVILFGESRKKTKLPPEKKEAIEWDLGFNSKKIQFEFNKSEIKPDSYVLLDNIANIMMNYPDLHFSIEGHTDDIGEESFNIELSLRRAVSVMNYLIGKGIDGKRLRVKGHGESKPLGDNSTEEGRALNRRVEIVIIQ